jgi:hypothetical protein
MSSPRRGDARPSDRISPEDFRSFAARAVR